jgi:hypothetical protein
MTIHHAGLRSRWMAGRWMMGCLMIAVVWVGMWFSNSLLCHAADDTQAFVEGLRQQRYFDTATAYLQHRADGADLPSDVKAGIAYQQALVLIESADHAADASARDQVRNEAAAKLHQFLTTNPEHELASQARDRLGGLELEIGDGILARATKLGGDQTKLRGEAQAKYTEARSTFEDTAARLRAQLDKLPAGEQREELGPEWLGACVNVGRAKFFMAMATEPGSEQRQQLLNDAAAQCSGLYQKYSKRLGGAVAHFYEGRCYQELGKHKEALAAYSDLIADLASDDAGLRLLKTQTIRQAQELWLTDEDFKSVADTAAWAKTARGAELQDPDWLAIKLSAATGLNKLIAASKHDAHSASYLHDARELASDVLKSKNSKLQVQAREVLAQLDRGGETVQPTPTTSSRTLPTPRTGARREVIQLAADTKTTQAAAAPAAAGASDNKAAAEQASFDELYDKASGITEDVKAAQMDLDFAHRDPTPDKKRIAEIESDLKAKRDEAMAACQQAIALPSAASNIDKLNQLRYWLCWFHYAKSNYYDAALLGEFLARKYPKSSEALPGAQVALASLDALHRQSTQNKEEGLFSAIRLENLANYMMQRWPNAPEAAAALDALVRARIDQGDYEKAQKIIEQTPADSPARASGEAKLGQALWVKYLQTMQQAREQKTAGAGTTADNPKSNSDDTQLKHNQDAMLKHAEKALQLGVDGLRKQDGVDERAVLAALSLAQLEVNTGHADKAVALLEDPKIGPLTLLKAHAPAAEVEGIPPEIYKTAMRAYVSVEPQQLDSATAAMNALEKLYANDPDGATRLTQILVGVAYDLQQQLDELNRAGDTDKTETTIRAFERFLNRIAEREKSLDYRTLNWIASTYESLANSETPGAAGQTGAANVGGDVSHKPPKLSPDAKKYLQQAVKAYEAILARAKDHPDEVSADKLSPINRRLAIDYRNLGDYEKSIAMFIDVLKEKPTLLPVQIEAAYTYQMRGENDNPDYFVGAMFGGKGPAESIWGWNQIAQKTARDKRFSDVFHEARYNMAVCRVEFADRQKNAADKQKLLELAKETIRKTKEYEATMGGSKWKPQYEKILRDIQKQLGEPVVGLIEFDQQKAEQSATQAVSDKK